MAKTPEALLSSWGLIYAAGRLTDVVKRIGTGEEGAADEEECAATYVETCPGFHLALPVLRWRWVYQRELAEYDPTLPGEALSAAVARLGWQSALGLPKKQVGLWVHGRFVKTLEAELVVRPFTFHALADEAVLPLAPPVAPKDAKRRDDYFGRVASQRHAEAFG